MPTLHNKQILLSFLNWEKVLKQNKLQRSSESMAVKHAKPSQLTSQQTSSTFNVVSLSNNLTTLLQFFTLSLELSLEDVLNGIQGYRDG